MGNITTGSTREIIDDFAEVIDRKKIEGKNPKKTVILFRRDRQDGIERPIWYVPTDLLRFRKDNGRIASEVASYEKLNAPLQESDDGSQKTLKQFLNDKDEAKTIELMKSLEHSEQLHPAIITSDGFLINGNRRKLALDKLFEKTKEDRFRWMRVVILPGKNDKADGGPPSLLEIEQIENRYQLQKEGKSEYFNFDRALSIRRKIQIGMTLEEQLRDDPQYQGSTEKEFKKEVAKVQKDLLDPLKCVDEYLEATNNEGLYDLIAQGKSDKGGRWQAFLDYSNYVDKKLSNPRQRLELGLDEDEVGTAKSIAFKLIRQRDYPDIKLHKLMRDYPKLLAVKESKNEIFMLKNIAMDTHGGGDQEDKDKIWSEKYASTIIRQVKKARDSDQYRKTKEKPINILEDVISNLKEDNLNPERLSITDLPIARKLAEDISKMADELSSEYYRYEKQTHKDEVQKRLEKKYRIRQN